MLVLVVSPARVSAGSEQQVEDPPVPRLDRHVQRLRPAAPEGVRPGDVHDARIGGDGVAHRAQVAGARPRKELPDGPVIPAARCSGQPVDVHLEGPPAAEPVLPGQAELRLGERRVRAVGAQRPQVVLGGLAQPLQARLWRQR